VGAGGPLCGGSDDARGPLGLFARLPEGAPDGPLPSLTRARQGLKVLQSSKDTSGCNKVTETARNEVRGAGHSSRDGDEGRPPS